MCRMFLYKLFLKPLLSLGVCVQTQETKSISCLRNNEMQFSICADSKALVLTGIMHIADYWDMVCCCVYTHLFIVLFVFSD